MKLFEFQFANVQSGLKRAWGLDVLDALGSLGFNDPARAIVAVVLNWRQVSEVRPSIIGNVTETDRINLILEFKAEQSSYFEFQSVPFIVPKTQQD